MQKLCAALLSLFVLVLARPAGAAFHEMKIVQVYGGSSGAPNAQYVMLQMYSPFQNAVSGHSVIFYNAAGTETVRYTFSSSVPNSNDQATILIGTVEADAAFNVTSDLRMTNPSVVLAGGKVCFDTYDCFSWGNYSLNDVGTPFQALPQGQAAIRNLGANGTLENADDTNQSAADFALGTPTPKPNPLPTPDAGADADAAADAAADAPADAPAEATPDASTDARPDAPVFADATVDAPSSSNDSGPITTRPDSGTPNQNDPPAEDSGGCTVRPGLTHIDTIFAVLAVLALGLVIRRRSR